MDDISTEPRGILLQTVVDQAVDPVVTEVTPMRYLRPPCSAQLETDTGPWYCSATLGHSGQHRAEVTIAVTIRVWDGS